MPQYARYARQIALPGKFREQMLTPTIEPTSSATLARWLSRAFALRPDAGVNVSRVFPERIELRTTVRDALRAAPKFLTSFYELLLPVELRGSLVSAVAPVVGSAEFAAKAGTPQRPAKAEIASPPSTGARGQAQWYEETAEAAMHGPATPQSLAWTIVRIAAREPEEGAVRDRNRRFKQALTSATNAAIASLKRAMAPLIEAVDS
jgi:hypothetical protein